MPRKSAAARQPEPEPASLPEVLIPPSQAKETEREAYWIELIDNPVDFKKAISTTTDFFALLKQLPEALWSGGRLSIYLYRLPDEDGLMVKNAEGQGKYIRPVIRAPIDMDWIGSRNGGGKYKLYLKLDSKETLREETVRIDGAPKVQAGQTVEVDGKSVAVGSATPTAQTADTRSDVATIIDANSKAEEKRMEMLLDANKASIELVKEQAAHNAPQRDPLTTAIELVKLLQPAQPAKDPTLAALEIVEKIDAMNARRNPQPAEAAEPEEPPLEKAMSLMEKMSGKSFSDLMKGKSPAAAPESAWAPFAPVALQFVTSLPNLLAELSRNKQIEIQARDLAFRREVWLRTAQPGENPPAELLAMNPAPAAQTPQRPAQPQPAASPAETQELDAMQLAGHIVQMVCHGFDSDPFSGAGNRRGDLLHIPQAHRVAWV